MICPLINVAVETTDRGPIQTILNGLPHSSGLKPCAGVLVTDDTVSHRYNTVQSVEVSSARQGPVAGVTENRAVAGMAVAARCLDDPVVMRRDSIMAGGAVLMAGIATEV